MKTITENPPVSLDLHEIARGTSPATMRAIVHDAYGSPDDLELAEISKPEFKDNEVLVRIHATSVNIGDALIIRGKPFLLRLVYGLRKPKNRVRGTDLSGTVEAVGKDVTEFRPGDAVFGSCKGSFTEYASAEETDLAPKPASLTFQQAAAVPMAAGTALQAVRDKGKVQPGQKVLINGASAGIGTFAVQIAKSLGAHVTGVCSTSNLDMVRAIGADQVIDYTQEDFTQSEQRYDFILDNVSNKSLAECRGALTPNGTLIPNGGTAGLGYILKANLSSMFMRKKARTFVSKGRKEDLVVLSELIEAGKVMPVIDRTYPLSQVPVAIRYLETRHARGKVVIAV
jgi:NADPH:quinone reductase-like Zn-dependent oxidoreductase